MRNVEQQRSERILVLSGGGGRGAYQVGVSEVLYESGWTPDVILGNSIGATNGAILAAPRAAQKPEVDFDTLFLRGAGAGGDEPDAFRLDVGGPGNVGLLKQVWLNEIAGNKLHQVSGEWPSLLGKMIRWGIALAQRMERPGMRVGGADEPLDDLVDALVQDVHVPRIPFGLTPNGLVKGVIKGLFARVERSLVDVLARPAVMDRQNWAALLEKHVDLDRLNDDRSTCPCLGVTAVRASTGELSYAWNRVPAGVNGTSGRADDTQAGISVQHLMASSSIPGIYPATEIGWEHWWDGALGANTPIAPAIDILLHNYPAKTEIVVVLMTPYDQAAMGHAAGQGAPPTVLDALQRFLDWMMLASLHKELYRLSTEQREWVRIVAPRELMGIVQIIDYGEEDVRTLIELGRQDATRALREDRSRA
jgi:NTE family protein